LNPTDIIGNPFQILTNPRKIIAIPLHYRWGILSPRWIMIESINGGTNLVSVRPDPNKVLNEPIEIANNYLYVLPDPEDI